MSGTMTAPEAGTSIVCGVFVVVDYFATKNRVGDNVKRTVEL